MVYRLGAVLLAGLIGVVGCQKAPPKHLTGTFMLQSEGRVLEFESVAKSGNDGSRLVLSGRGTLRVDLDTSILRLDKVELENLSQGAPRRIFAEPRAWTLRLRAEGFEADRPLTPEETWISKALSSYWKASKPEGGERTEVELDGKNLVRYSVKGTDVVRTWLRREADRADLPEMPNRDAIPVDAEVSGSLAYNFLEGFPSQIKGSKKTISSMGGRMVGESHLQLLVQLARAEDGALKFRSAARYSLIDPSSAAANEVEIQRKYLGDATLPDLLKRAEQRLSTEARNQVFLALRALFYLNPNQCSTASKMAAGDSVKDLVAEALAGAGHGKAQTAFLEILKASTGASLRKRLALLIPLTHLQPDLEKQLLGLAFGDRQPAAERNVAQLVVGSNVRRCLDANPAQAKRLSDQLVRALTLAEDDDARHNLLYALGNAGNPALRDLQSAYLKSDSAVLRRAGVHSLRHLVDPTTRAVLKAMLEVETDLNVRAEIEDVLSRN